MTYFEGQRWVATASELVTFAILSVKGDSKFEKRFWEKVDKRGECWVWKNALSSEGYGHISIMYAGKEYTVRAHRIAYMHRFGAVSEELFLDHVFPVCIGRWCVNPDHLEPVTQAENTRRGQGIGRKMQRQARNEEIRRRDHEHG